MASGLVALLDDIAGLTRLAAASLDDVAGATGRVGIKAAGVVIDDTAVTPRYVTGLAPERELPIIARIALGSLRNKLLFLLPAALVLSAFAPWAITPLLALGGVYLCFEGAEKVAEAVAGPHGPEPGAASIDPAQLERAKVAQAVRTDFILSAEIMAIALADVMEQPLLTQAVVLALVGLAITAGVYGVVAVIVKVDDVGLHLARRSSAALRAVGRALVAGMPVVMSALAIVGTAAMLWVGGGILLHALDVFGFHALPGAVHGFADGAAAALPVFPAATAWIVNAAGAGLLGLVVGLPVVAALHLTRRLTGAPASH